MEVAGGFVGIAVAAVQPVAVIKDARAAVLDNFKNERRESCFMVASWIKRRTCVDPFHLEDGSEDIDSAVKQRCEQVNRIE